MDQQRRVLLAVALCVGVSFVYTQLVVKPKLDAQLEAAALVEDAGVAPAAPSPAPTVAAAVDPDGGAVAQAPDAPAAAQAPTARTLELPRASMKLVASTQGAGLVDAVLTGKRERNTEDLSILQGWQKLFGKHFEAPKPIDLADPPDFGLPQLGLSIAGSQPLDARLIYAVTEEAPGKVVFTGTQGPWRVTKTLGYSADDTAPARYLFSLDVTLENVSAQPAAGELMVHAARGIAAGSEQTASLFGGIGNESTVLCRHGDDVERKRPDDKEPEKRHSGQLHFVGIDQQYFLTAVWPRDGAVDGACALHASSTVRSASLAMPVTLGPGERRTQRFAAFLGPKDLDLLLALDKPAAGSPEGATAAAFRPGLDRTVDFGMWAFICKGLLFFLRLFHGFVGNWGLAIILLTVMVKLALLPLTHKAMVSAEQMKKLQPKMEELKKKYPDDRERQNVEMMKLYQEAKVNPLGGCLPLLLQMPIWIALFTTLRTSYELYGEPFVGPVWTDLTSKDPSYILPLALGVTMIITQRLQPQMMDQSQVFLMTWVMPIFFTAMMMNYPAGLALYIFTNNLLSILQQFLLKKYLARTGQLGPPAKSAGATS